jgi:uncharacterized protein (DUF342 family)
MSRPCFSSLIYSTHSKSKALCIAVSTSIGFDGRSTEQIAVVSSTLRNESSRWEQQVKTLKSFRSQLSNKKKLIDDEVATQEDFKKYLLWIKKEGDAEQALEDIEDNINPQKYENYAE